MPIQEIPSIYVKKDKMIDGTHRRPCQPRPQGKLPRDEEEGLPCPILPSMEPIFAGRGRVMVVKR